MSRVLSALGRALRALFLIVFLLGRSMLSLLRRLRPRRRIVPEPDTDARAEWAIFFLLLAATAAAVMFLLVYVLDLAHSTQFLGLALGASLALMAAAFLVLAKRVVGEQTSAEDYSVPGEQLEHRDDEERLLQRVRESGELVTRRKLIGGAGAAAGAALGAALVAPAASLGPVLDTASLYESPWRRGRRLVDDRERPYPAAEIERGTFYTAYPEGGDPDKLGSPLIVVRLDPAELDLPEGREDWAPDGILAYSKVCTHAGCAVSLYRDPLYPEAERKPAFVCPCHYSTFDPADGGSVLFGPAGRSLPQLPLEIDSQGGLRAAGNLSSPPGPSFWGSRTRGAS